MVFGIFTTVIRCVVRFIIGNGREINAYMTQQKMPIKQETISSITPTISESAKAIARGIKEGLKEEEK